jgi:hypothetical protein
MNSSQSVISQTANERQRDFYSYGVYGIDLRSNFELALPRSDDAGVAKIELHSASGEWFEKAIMNADVIEVEASWYRYAQLCDGSRYARWERVGEFLVSPKGDRIGCRQFAGTANESFHVYLLGQAISFALVQQGMEPLHATVIEVEGQAVVFLGESGAGKSTLASFFLSEGHRLVTDDLLLLSQSPEGVLAYPGPARLKLFPSEALRFLPNHDDALQMNPFTQKAILRLNQSQHCAKPIPVGAMYTLAAIDPNASTYEVKVEALSPREAFLELVKNTFNYRIIHAERLKRQFFEGERLAQTVGIKKLSYQRNIELLGTVYETILEDLGSSSNKTERPTLEP